MEACFATTSGAILVFPSGSRSETFSAVGLSHRFRIEKAAQRGSFRARYPGDIGGHSRGYPGPKLRSGPLKPRANKHFGADIHGPIRCARPRPQRDCQNLRSEKLWAEFSFRILVCAHLCCKNLCCASRFCTGGGAGGSRSKNSGEDSGCILGCIFAKALAIYSIEKPPKSRK